MDLFETLYTCCGHIEDMHVGFGGARNTFDRITAFRQLILGNFLHCRVWRLCNQLLLQFSMDHFETMLTCYRYIEDVHMNFCR